MEEERIAAYEEKVRESLFPTRTSEDIYFSEKTLAEIKSGKQKTYPAEEVYKKLRL